MMKKTLWIRARTHRRVEKRKLPFFFFFFFGKILWINLWIALFLFSFAPSGATCDEIVTFDLMILLKMWCKYCFVPFNLMDRNISRNEIDNGNWWLDKGERKKRIKKCNFPILSLIGWRLKLFFQKWILCPFVCSRGHGHLHSHSHPHILHHCIAPHAFQSKMETVVKYSSAKHYTR